VVTNPATPTTVSPQIVSSNGGTVSVTFSGGAPSTVGSVVVLDTSVPQQSVTGTITCSTPAPPPPSAIVITPSSATLGCLGSAQTAVFVVTGGTPPYTVFWATVPNAGATINGMAYPATVSLGTSGSTFTVANLLNPPSNPVNITVTDSGSSVQTVSITCK